MDRVAFPRDVDAPQRFLLWSVDQFIPFAVFLGLGIFFDRVFTSILVGIAVSFIFSRWRDSKQDQYLVHMAHWFGILSPSKLRIGIPYDTGHATMIASVTSVDAANGLNLRRLYRADTGNWFVAHCNWWHRLFVASDEFLWQLSDKLVLPIAMSLVPDKDCRSFLLDWYGAGFIPRNDEFARAWAGGVLSGKDLKAVRASIAKLPPES